MIFQKMQHFALFFLSGSLCKGQRKGYMNQSTSTSHRPESRLDVLPGCGGRKIASSLSAALRRQISFSPTELRDDRFRVRLYRFLTDTIPIISSVVWTWSRLAAAPGRFLLYRDDRVESAPDADAVLTDLFGRLTRPLFGHPGTVVDLLTAFFQSLVVDGRVAGRIEISRDLSRILALRFWDSAATTVAIDRAGSIAITIETESGEKVIRGEDLFYYPLNAQTSDPYGRSLLRSVPFISYVEQQLVDDMRRSMHNAGYNRMHIKITPPERRQEESEQAYHDRANAYFDRTVSMVREIDVEDNPVTWNDVQIDYIGPSHQGGPRTSSWYLNHRAMVEEICAGTHLAPFLLGYSYNATTNWAHFKYDLVMRQVASLQQTAAGFLDWIAGIELALRGFSLKPRWQFKNDLSALAKDEAEIRQSRVETLLKLYEAGLVDKETAASRAVELV
jgi:hypothetical protein